MMPKRSNTIRNRTVSVALLIFVSAFGLSTLCGYIAAGGVALALFWFAAALAARLSEKSRPFAYPLVVIGCVTSSMYFPWLYREYFGLPTTRFVIPILQVIMFGMGTQLSLKDFRQILVQPWGVLIGVGAQFLIMPIVGVTIATLFPFPKEIAAGIILVGCVPCGIASNVMNFLAKANIALSLSLTTVATLLGPIMTPLWMKILIGETLALDYAAMALDITNLVIFPILAGILFHTVVSKDARAKHPALQAVVFFTIIAAIVLGFGLYNGTENASILSSIFRQSSIFLIIPFFGVVF